MKQLIFKAWFPLGTEKLQMLNTTNQTPDFYLDYQKYNKQL